MATKDFNTATLTAKNLYGNTPTTTTGTGDAVYTCPTNRCAKLSTMTLCNTHSAAVTVDVYAVPNGATPGTQHKIVNTRSLAVNETLSLTALIQGMMLGESDSIRVKPSVASVLNVAITGVEGA